MAVFLLGDLPTEEAPVTVAAWLTIDEAPRLERGASWARPSSRARRASSVPDTFELGAEATVERPRRASATSSGRGSGRLHAVSKKASAMPWSLLAYLRSLGAHFRDKSVNVTGRLRV